MRMSMALTSRKSDIVVTTGMESSTFIVFVKWLILATSDGLATVWESSALRHQKKGEKLGICLKWYVSVYQTTMSIFLTVS
jgi:hypothetical protein